jgi:CheY-like chemotaxis protein
MSKTETKGIERRTARRYRVPGSARVFWGGDGAPVSIADMSAGGCLVIGDQLPDVGTRVFLSLDIGGLPNVRLPAITVRCDRDRGESMAAVRFDVPATSVGGLDKLLAQHVRVEARGSSAHPQRNVSSGLRVLVVDSDLRSRERIAHAVRAMGAEVVVSEGDLHALGEARDLTANVVLARADSNGLSALAIIARDRPSAFRVAFGRKSAVMAAVLEGIAQATADDPSSAKCLGELLRKGRLRTPS